MFFLFIVLAIASIIIFFGLYHKHELKKYGVYEEYKRIGPYTEYKKISKLEKSDEYILLQLNGFKNVNDTVLKNLRKISSCRSKKDLPYLDECSDILLDSLIESAGKKYSDPKYYIDDNLYNSPDKVNTYKIIDAIYHSRKPLNPQCQVFGCKTCGEAMALAFFCETQITGIEDNDSNMFFSIDDIVNTIIRIRNSTNK